MNNYISLSQYISACKYWDKQGKKEEISTNKEDDFVKFTVAFPLEKSKYIFLKPLRLHTITLTEHITLTYKF